MEANKVFTRILVYSTLFLLVSVLSSMAGDAPPVPEDGPVIVFDATQFQFEEIMDGDFVTHKFSFTNKGTADLEIRQVKTTCGCTTTSYTRYTAPGETGSVEIRLNTRGYGGAIMRKEVSVLTNDPSNPATVLKLAGPVTRFVRISPTTIQLRKGDGEEATGSAKIIPVEGYPFKITRTSATAKARFTYNLEEFSNDKEKGWVLTVNDPQPEGRYSGTVYLYTDSKLKPRLEVRVYANFSNKQPTRITRRLPKDKS